MALASFFAHAFLVVAVSSTLFWAPAAVWFYHHDTRQHGRAIGFMGCVSVMTFAFVSLMFVYSSGGGSSWLVGADALLVLLGGVVGWEIMERSD